MPYGSSRNPRWRESITRGAQMSLAVRKVQERRKRQAVLDLLMLGFSDKEIAKHARMTLRSVKNVVSRLLKAYEIPACGEFHPRIRLIYLRAIELGYL